MRAGTIATALLVWSAFLACGASTARHLGHGSRPQPALPQIDVVGRSYQIVRHRRQKYRCRYGRCVDMALGPLKLIPGGSYSIDFAVHVAEAKDLDDTPL